MSLTSFLSIKDVKQRFNEQFKVPRLTLASEIKASPLTKNWALNGTAFDYLMRFRLERLNHSAHARPWIAEELLLDPRFYVTRLGNKLPGNVTLALNADTRKWFFYGLKEELEALYATETPLTRHVRETVKQARKSHDAYVATGFSISLNLVYFLI